MIAGPGSSQFFGAMENWGAIFYFEPTLLFDPSHESASDKEDIFLTVAHEMAHQWFGDLVTPSWWDDLWLNEGFASWMSNKAMNDLNPGWNVAAQNVAFDREGALGIDATAATHPIIRHLTTVDQIGSAFDGITYSKGQAVIGMIESTVGADTFRAGIRDYMAKYKYGNTVTDQLWAEIGKAWGKPIAGIAHDFTLQGGVPLIKVASESCSGGATTLELSQGRFGIDAASKTPQTWHVPVKIGALGGGVADGVVSGAAETPMTVKGCAPVVVNLGKQSYFRAQYDAKDHAALVAQFPKMALTDQLGTLGDDMALARGGYQDLGVYFDTLGAAPQDADPLVWSMIADDVGGLADLYSDTPLEQPLRTKAEAVLAPVLQRVGFDPKPDEKPYLTDLRATLIRQLGFDGDPALLAEARSYVAALKNDPDAIPAAIRDPILRTYAYNATPAEWEALLAMTRTETNPVIKNADVNLLGRVNDDALAQRALDLVKTDTFTDPQRASLLAVVAVNHPDMAFDFAVANRDMVNGLLEESARAGYIVGLGARSNDPAMPGKIQAFADAHLPAASRQGVKESLTAIANRKAVADRLRAAVTKWVAE